MASLAVASVFINAVESMRIAAAADHGHIAECQIRGRVGLCPLPARGRAKLRVSDDVD